MSDGGILSSDDDWIIFPFMNLITFMVWITGDFTRSSLEVSMFHGKNNLLGNSHAGL